MLVEYSNKGIPSSAWAELVLTLEKLFEWAHPPEGIHKVICWELGKVQEQQTSLHWQNVRISKLQAGRYQLHIGADSIEVYVLRELLH
ncbi:MAG: hypothetical protein HY535_04710 [Chloroflexi bacterium]|nr:hypothetical protein [Chloroflexota bacterium]